ncbi:oxygen-independent coproporphyrinogen III oxidase [Luteitalea sp. TBR-22]|uniref:oxygen-independent coproporphyrinogen III oxidase n=1 Tax=Luteitalea sp. TBR-22 TaxID=2802971 RepID=UPI001AF7C11F|nr:oxygen-independent coproporphyrinogen III oxidase [Luteitalea sp. TBR-22]BCS32163.1 oxygen-independent coproporphyrinogen III oxidase [Luteitalea sp. TBR-22]
MPGLIQHGVSSLSTPGTLPVPGDLDGQAVTLDLLRRYDRPGPRYTSYPTAVEFHEGFGADAYATHLARAAAQPDAPLSLYVHLPFCESRCAFCGCSVIVTKKRHVAEQYLGYLVREIGMVAAALRGRRRVVQYHWGGGTPSYLLPSQMRVLHEAVREHFDLDLSGELALEVDPRVTSFEQLETLRALGFNRLSLGVQDFDPGVQEAVNRIQGVEATRALVERARDLGFGSINVDLIYGLPRQELDSFARTVDTVIGLRPDRVAAYSFAHVPWIRAHQKLLKVEELPSADRKLQLFVDARARFLAAGYVPIGMDHFALPGDELAHAAAAGRLHRNFMGYTTRPAADMIGLGVSAIGDVAGAFAQNTKKLSAYYAAITEGRFPVERGYALDEDDHLRRHVVTQLMCNLHLDTREVERRFGVDFDGYFARERGELAEGPMAHGFLVDEGGRLRVTPRGRLFVRNICMIFDRHLREKRAATPVFSRTV